MDITQERNGSDSANECTLQEAVRRICPFLGTADGDESSVPSSFHGRGVSPFRCYASQCMAWRWGKLQKRHEIPHRMTQKASYELHKGRLPIPNRPEGVPESYVFRLFYRDYKRQAVWEEDDATYTDRCQGYCGLVGLKNLPVRVVDDNELPQ